VKSCNPSCSLLAPGCRRTGTLTSLPFTVGDQQPGEWASSEWHSLEEEELHLNTKDTKGLKLKQYSS
jgi:hypothetical protein